MYKTPYGRKGMFRKNSEEHENTNVFEQMNGMRIHGVILGKVMFFFGFVYVLKYAFANYLTYFGLVLLIFFVQDYKENG